MHCIYCMLQLTLQFVNCFAHLQSFPFSTGMTFAMPFCHVRDLPPGPDLNLDGYSVPVMEAARFFYLQFYSNRTWVTHIQELKVSATAP